MKSFFRLINALTVVMLSYSVGVYNTIECGGMHPGFEAADTKYMVALIGLVYVMMAVPGWTWGKLGEPDV